MAEGQEEAFDFGFTAVDKDELADILSGGMPDIGSAEIDAIKDKLDLILELNATCEGTGAVKLQYDELMKAKMQEVERLVVPLFNNLMQNSEKDYLYWPGSTRVAQCELQLERMLRITQV